MVGLSASIVGDNSPLTVEQLGSSVTRDAAIATAIENSDLTESDIRAKVDEFDKLDKRVDDLTTALDAARSDRRKIVRWLREQGLRNVDITRILEVPETWISNQLRIRNNYGERTKTAGGVGRGRP